MSGVPGITAAERSEGFVPVTATRIKSAGRRVLTPIRRRGCLCSDTVYDTAIKHRPRVAQNAFENGAIRLANCFGVVSCLHRSAHNNIVVTTKHVHDPPVPAPAAEEIELLGKRLTQGHKMSASRDNIIVAHYRLRTVSGTINDDVFSQFCEIDFALKMLQLKWHPTSL